MRGVGTQPATQALYQAASIARKGTGRVFATAMKLAATARLEQLAGFYGITAHRVFRRAFFLCIFVHR